MKKAKKFWMIACLGVLGAHLVFSALMALITSSLYDSRMVNVRHLDFDKSLHPLLIRSFLLDNVRKEDYPNILIVGSSFSWGYPFPKARVFSSGLQERALEYKVVNASVVGDSPTGTLGILCLADNLGLRVDTLIVEINIANFARLKEMLSKPYARCIERGGWGRVDAFLPYTTFFIQNPFGLSHFKIIHDEFNYKRPRDRKFRFNKVRDGYFNTAQKADETYKAKKSVLIPLLEVSKRVANRVVFFIAPINGYGVSLSQFKLSDLKYQAQRFLKLCRTIGGIECLDIRFDMDKSYFMNLTHLNMKGHRYFSEYLAEIVLSNESRIDLGAPIDSMH